MWAGIRCEPSSEGPDLELVGVHAASAEKIGQDAAELCGLDKPTGVIATDDVGALIDLGADCVVYTSQGETRPMEAIEQMAKFLAAGTNVVGTSMVWLVTLATPKTGCGSRWSGPARPATPPSTSTESTRVSPAIRWCTRQSA